MTEKSQTEELREALAQLPVRQMCCRAAEYAALIRYRRPTAAAEELCEHLRLSGGDAYRNRTTLSTR